MSRRNLTLAALLLLAPLAVADDLPADATKRLKAFDDEAAAIRKKIEGEVDAARDKLIQDLTALADRLAKDAKADDAAAVKAKVAELRLEAQRSKNLVVNGGFEDGPATNENPGFNWFAEGSTDITGWKITVGSVEQIGKFWMAAEGKRSLDLSGTSAGTISQSFKTVKGQEYVVTFKLAGNTDGGEKVKKLRVSAGGRSADFEFDTTDRTTTDMGWVTKTYEFTATGEETTLEFASLGGENDQNGPALDDVIVLKK